VVSLRLLSPQERQLLAGQSVTFQETGPTGAAGPAGYHGLTRTRTLPETVAFDTARRGLLTWQVQERTGLRLAVSSLEITEGASALMWLGRGPLTVRIPVRVVDLVDETDTAGFAYGTLPGHPEAGKETFTLTRRPDGRVDFTITAISRPATLLAKVGGPLTSAAQRIMTRRYLRALDRV
jgi:uncharacterized protein (UPF0548 family)